MDCGALAAQQQQQQLLQQHQQLLQQQQQLQHSRQQKQQHTLNCLEETATTNISQLASQGIIVGGAASEGSETTAGVGAGAGAGGSPQHKLLGIGEPSLSGAGAVKLRKHNDQRQTSSTSTTTTTSTTDVAVGAKSHTSYRISMANLEDTQESELDLILGELSLLEAQITYGEASFLPGVVAAAAAAAASANQQSGGPPPPPALASVSVSAASSRTHSRTNSSISADVSTASSSSGISENGVNGMAMGHSNVVVGITGMPGMGMGTAAVVPPTGGHNMTMGITLGVVTPREPRTESPDNDSAFSDTVSLLSSESSASSNTSTQQQQQQQQLQLQQKLLQQQQHHHQTVTAGGNVGISKAAKIQLALHKLESASIRRLFVKAFTADGASKSLLVDERMVCGHVTRLLADKNHVQMQPTWALIEHLGDLQMERLFEDHELLVDNLMTWNSDAGNRVLFQQRPDKLSLFAKPELYLPGPQMAPGCQHDDQTRYMLLEEFFETHAQLQLEGPLYMKADPKKGWKRHHFVLRSSGLYYFPKEKTKNTRDLLCLTLFSGHNVYTGIGWRKKWKSPTDHTFGFKSAVDSSLGKSCRSLKMLCAEDAATLERWLTAIRICKYGKQLWHNHKLLMEELTAGGGGGGGGGGGVGATSGGISGMAGSFAASMRSESISSISSAVPSQCGSVSSAISSMSNSSGRISRASSSSSSGCLSDENNAFDSEFTTGTIKRKPSMKPNLPLTTMTRQLKEVGEITTGPVASSAAASAVDSAASPERSGTLTRRHSRRKSQESNGSSGGTLKRRPVVVVPAVVKREVSASDNGSQSGGGNGGGGNSSSSSNSTPTPTPSICAKPPPGLTDVELMCSSTLSLDSLPPPPPPPALHADEQDVYGSQLSLASLPPPPPPEDVLAYGEQPSTPLTPTPMSMSMGMGMGMPHPLSMANSNGTLPPAVPAKPIKPAVKQTLKAAPPYKAPPDYVGPAATVGGAGATVGTPTATTQHQQQQQQQQQLPPPPAPVQKKVSFADSPVLLRRKMCSPEPQLPQRSPSTTLSSGSSSCSYHQPQTQPQPIYSPGPLLPPRSDLSRLSNGSDVMSATTSPKRLQESASNPPRDFLKDLQRVMRKKWQVAQKCKLEPATTPHEVLGFRDFNNDDLLAAHNLNSGANSSHYYRETANVSHWVQEHCEYAHNDYALYENVHAQNGNGNGATAVGGVAMTTITTTDGPPPVPPPAAVADATAALRKKRPPPPPPKRSDSTHLTHRV